MHTTSSLRDRLFIQISSKLDQLNRHPEVGHRRAHEWPRMCHNGLTISSGEHDKKILQSCLNSQLRLDEGVWCVCVCAERGTMSNVVTDLC